MEREKMALVYERLKNTVYRVALTYCGNRQDAEDITQDVFLTMFRSGKEFPTEEDEKAWAIRVAMNKSKNLLKSFHRSRSADLEEASGVCAIAPDNNVQTAINSLPDKYRIVIYLYYIEGYSVRETARLTSRSESAVQVQLHRGRKMLKKLLKEDMDI